MKIAPLLAITLAAAMNAVNADMYAYVDENGIKHVSTIKIDERWKLAIKTPKYVRPKGKKLIAKSVTTGPKGQKWTRHVYRDFDSGKKIIIRDGPSGRYETVIW
jgi:hypothetical protein